MSPLSCVFWLQCRSSSPVVEVRTDIGAGGRCGHRIPIRSVDCDVDGTHGVHRDGGDQLARPDDVVVLYAARPNSTMWREANGSGVPQACRSDVRSRLRQKVSNGVRLISRQRQKVIGPDSIGIGADVRRVRVDHADAHLSLLVADVGEVIGVFQPVDHLLTATCATRARLRIRPAHLGDVLML